MIKCDICNKDCKYVLYADKVPNKNLCSSCYFDLLMSGKCDECGDKGNEVQLEFVNGILLCESCYKKGVNDE